MKKSLAYVGVALIGTLVLTGCATPPLELVSKLDSYRQLNSDEVTRLFSDRTVTSRNLASGTVSHTYYSTDGDVRQVRNGRERTGNWSVRKDGRICLKMEKQPRSCRIVRRGEDGVYRKYPPGKPLAEPLIEYRAFVRGDRLAQATPVGGFSAQHARVQRLLQQAGYAPGPIDGIWGGRSRAAMARFQADNGLQVTGIPAPDTLEVLGRHGEKSL